jgi:hydrogenase/urease accessory protein HupE
MNRRADIASRLLTVALLGLLAAPSALAHGLDGNADPNRPVIDYLWLGIRHMIGGWDHLLFIAGVVLLAGGLRTAAKLVSVFVAGHSLTLLIATLAGWQLNADRVDAVIALSLVYVGVLGIRRARGSAGDLRLIAAGVFVFGLVHGLGLSTRPQHLGLPDDGLVGRILLFNLGVEIGQLTALAAIVGLGTLVARQLRNSADMRRYAFGALAVSGLLAAAVLSFPSEETRSNQQTVADTRGAASACTQRDSAMPRFAGGGHPAKRFFGPREQARDEDLVHVITDGLIAVRYHPELPAGDVRALKRFVNHPDSEFVVAAPDLNQTEPVHAVAAYRTLTCSTVDLEGLGTFRDKWLAYVRELQAQQG